MGQAAEVKSRPGVAQQRRDIIAAAVRLFAVAGTAPVSVSAICQEAGVSRDTFYRCFDNKDQLVDALYSNTVSANMLAVTSSAKADFTDEAWLRTTIDDTVDAILSQREVAQFLFLEAADPESHAHRVIGSAFDGAARSMQRWCRKRYGQAPSKACFTGLLSAAQWLVHEAINKGMKPKQVAEAKRAIEELFLATFRGLQP
ncbi:MAG: helix-turn-helix domain-containing protein [Pseudomonadota bacterium]